MMIPGRSAFICALATLLLGGVTTGCKTKKKGKTVASKEKGAKGADTKSGSDATKKGGDTTKKSDPGTTSVSPGGSDSKGGTGAGNPAKTPVTAKGGTGDSKSPATKGATTKPGKQKSKAEILKEKIDEKYAFARAYLKKRGDKNQENAIEAARDVLKLDYEHFGAILVIAEAQYNMGSYGKMLAALNRISLLRSKQSPPTKPTARWHILMGRYYLHLTRDYEKKGFVLKAMFQKNKAIKEFAHSSTDGNAEALFVRGSLYLESGDYDKALKWLSKAESLNDAQVKNNWRLYLNLGVTYIYKHSYQLAEKKLSYCLRALNANCMKCHFNLALIYSLWDEVPKLGTYTTSQRAKLAIKHAGQYRAWLKSQRRYDKSLVEKLDRWISIANSK